MNDKKVIETLSKIFDLELAGVVRYTHYALMIFGSNRLPLIEFFRAQAKESLMHADLAGEHITGLGGHPPLNTNNIEANFWLIPNAYHVDAMLKYPDEYGQRMKQFFEENLK